MILLTSSVVKFVDRERFERIVAELDFVGPAAMFLSAVVPLAEATMAGLLLFSRQPSLSLIFAAGLMGVFSLVSALSRLEDCGCGPFLPKRTAPRIALTILLGLACALAAASRTAPAVVDRLLAFGTAAVTVMVVNLLVGS